MGAQLGFILVSPAQVCYNKGGRIRFSKTPPIEQEQPFQPDIAIRLCLIFVRIIYGTG